MPLPRLAELYGVATSYAPAPGRTVPVPDAAVIAALAALGVDASTPEAVRGALAAGEAERRARLLPPTVVWWRGREVPAVLAELPPGTRLLVEIEQGGTRTWTLGTPDDVPSLPSGVHGLTADAPGGRGARVWLIVAPERMPALGAGGAECRAGAYSAVPAAVAPTPVAPAAVAPAPAGVAPAGPPPAAGDAGAVHGLLVQLYSVLSERSWGMGDLGDLAELAAWAGRVWGSGFVQVNPLHSGAPGRPADPSPYRPSSRLVPDPVHLRVEDIHEYAYLGAADRAQADRLAARAARLRGGVLHDGALIDRDAVWALKRRALELVGRVPLGPGRYAAYADFRAEAGGALEDHATWCALAEVHGGDWTTWPQGLREPRSTATARARRRLTGRVAFHSRLAWYADGQLAAAQRAARDAGMPVGLVHDLAIGVHPCGADAWAQQEYLAPGMSVGAPPDAFNARGQDWGLPPWRPDRLAAAGYAPYRRLLRGLFRHAGALRIDHVMGLFRLWWIPQGHAPTEGTYVSYDAEAMLAILALEAHRAGSLVIGEDLGTVAPGMREILRAHGVLGTSVLWFERTDDGGGAGAGRPLPPERWRPDCLATATTHDLPPTAARLSGAYVELRHRLGLLTKPLADEQAAAVTQTAEWLELLTHLGLLTANGTGVTGTDIPGDIPGFDILGPTASPQPFPSPQPLAQREASAPSEASAPPQASAPPEAPGEEELIRAFYRFLLRTPAHLVGVWLPDAVGDRRPQNLPGTWQEYPNWRLPIADAQGHPLTLEQLAASPRLHALMSVLSAGRAKSAPGSASPEDTSGDMSRDTSVDMSRDTSGDMSRDTSPDTCGDTAGRTDHTL